MNMKKNKNHQDHYEFVVHYFNGSSGKSIAYCQKCGVEFEIPVLQILSKKYLLSKGFKLHKGNSFINCILPYYAKDAVLLFFNDSPPENIYLIGYRISEKEGYYAANFRWIDKPKQLEEIYKAIIGKKL